MVSLASSAVTKLEKLEGRLLSSVTTWSSSDICAFLVSVFFCLCFATCCLVSLQSVSVNNQFYNRLWAQSMLDMAESFNKWSIDRLDSSNWVTWKFQMRHLLLAKGLWRFVNGSEALPGSPTAAQVAEFNKKCQNAFSTMVMSISLS